MNVVITLWTNIHTNDAVMALRHDGIKKQKQFVPRTREKSSRGQQNP